MSSAGFLISWGVLSNIEEEEERKERDKKISNTPLIKFFFVFLIEVSKNGKIVLCNCVDLFVCIY